MAVVVELVVLFPSFYAKAIDTSKMTDSHHGAGWYFFRIFPPAAAVSFIGGGRGKIDRHFYYRRQKKGLRMFSQGAGWNWSWNWNTASGSTLPSHY